MKNGSGKTNMVIDIGRVRVLVEKEMVLLRYRWGIMEFMDHGSCFCIIYSTFRQKVDSLLHKHWSWKSLKKGININFVTLLI